MTLEEFNAVMREIHEPKPSGYLVRAAKRIRDREHKRIVTHSYPDWQKARRA